MEPLLLLLGLAFAANKIVSVIKSLASPDKNTALTQLLVWVIGLFVLILAGNASVTEHLVVPGLSEPLGDLDFASYVIVTLITGSSGSVVYDFKKALDNTDSAGEPRLLEPTTTHREV
jgi:hypothetical protein